MGKTVNTRGKLFYLVMSLTFWLIMMVGFSDNWLTDVSQPSNSEPKFLIHAAFAFGWFTLLPVQSALIRRGSARLHMSLGISGMAIYAGFFGSTSFIYVTRTMAEGFPGPLALLNMVLFVYATVLIVRGFLVRHRDSATHKANILIGTLFLMEPALSRTIGHLFGKGSEGIWLLSFLILFAVFIWQYRRIPWQLGIGCSLWILGTANIILKVV